MGMKSRGVYETPGGSILLAARRGLESITLDRGEAHLKDELMPKYFSSPCGLGPFLDMSFATCTRKFGKESHRTVEQAVKLTAKNRIKPERLFSSMQTFKFCIISLR